MFTFNTDSSIQLEYLAEGAANIVYKIIPPPSSPSTAADADLDDSEYPPTEIAPPQMDPALEGKLIRLRKATLSSVSVVESHQRFEKNIKVLFDDPNWLVDQVLFKPTQHLLRALNMQLRSLESQKRRPGQRHGAYLDEDEEFGLLVTDMSCSTPSSAGYRCLEFKPKWLVQSPSAPRHAKRCRTCALRHFKKSSNIRSKVELCPLGLMSADRTVVAETVKRIFGLDPTTKVLGKEDEALKSILIDSIHMNMLLKNLSMTQLKSDPKGVLYSEDWVNTQNFLTAMTLRDCTLFLKIPINGQGEIETRLGDLDFKSPGNGKAEYWRGLEKELVDGGWYTATESPKVEDDGICVLSAIT